MHDNTQRECAIDPTCIILVIQSDILTYPTCEDTPLDATGHECFTKYQDDLGKIIDYLKTRDVPLIVVAIPDPMQVYQGEKDTHAFIREAIELGAYGQFIDLQSDFVNNGDIEALFLLARNPEGTPEFLGNVHLTRYGYLLMARIMSPHIEAAIQDGIHKAK